MSKKDENKRREYQMQNYSVYYFPITGEVMCCPKKRSVFGELHDHHYYINYCTDCGQRVKLFVAKRKRVVCERCKKD